jgi:hypothetical protein
MCGTTNAPLGTTCTDNHGTTCDGEGKCVAGKYVFLTSSAIPANLGAALGNGARAYDTQCGTIATGRGFQGTWMAWISDSTTSPSVRFSQPLVNYLQLDGTVVAAGWAGLIASSGPSITVTELLASMSGSEVWTATDGTGAFTGASCSDWTTLVHSPSTTATVGVAGSGSTWTSDYAQYCDYGYQHLYCFQQ